MPVLNNTRLETNNIGECYSVKNALTFAYLSNYDYNNNAELVSKKARKLLAGFNGVYFIDNPITSTEAYVFSTNTDLIISFRGTELTLLPNSLKVLCSCIIDSCTDCCACSLIPAYICCLCSGLINQIKCQTDTNFFSCFSNLCTHFKPNNPVIIHDGFRDAFNSIWKNKLLCKHNTVTNGGIHLPLIYDDKFISLFDIIQIEARNNPNVNIWFTGHSLGAALATLAAYNCPYPNNIKGIYTFGTPGVGNKAFVDDFNSRLRNIDIRFQNSNDIVTRLTPNNHDTGHNIYIDCDGNEIEEDEHPLLQKVKMFSDHSMEQYIAKIEHEYNHGRVDMRRRNNIITVDTSLLHASRTQL